MPGKLTSNRRAYRSGGLARFINPPVTEPSPLWEAELRPDHKALSEGRTIFPTRVFNAGDRGRILIDGINNAKIGKYVTVGPWKGFRIFTFALEERATCPRSCGLWASCYGNALPVAVRFRYNDGFLMSIEEELVTLGDRFPNGFAVRAHVLGDFVDLDYVRHWQLWMEMVPALHVWGYTAHQAGTEIGDAVYAMNHTYAGRWAFRNSVAPDLAHDGWQASTTWTKPVKVSSKGYRAIGGVVCPAEVGATATCGTCGLCWSPAAKDTRIVFLGHGMRRSGRRSKTVDKKPEISRPVDTAHAQPIARYDDVAAFIAARGVTRLPIRARGL